MAARAQPYVDPSDAAQAADTIARLMDGSEWNADMLEEIAQHLRDAGYEIREADEVDDDEEGG